MKHRGEEENSGWKMYEDSEFGKLVNSGNLEVKRKGSSMVVTGTYGGEG